MIRTVLVSALTVYLTVGLLGGWVMSQAIPAMNWRGVGFYAVTWPAFVFCAERECNPLAGVPVQFQALLFTFDQEPDQ